MGDTNTAVPPVDVSTIHDADTRRAMRGLVQMNQQLAARVGQQQQEIEALLQMMVEKHVGSVGEFKRHMLKMQQGHDARSERIHGQIAGTPAAAAPGHAAAPSAAPAAPRVEPRPRVAEPEIDRPRRYTL